MLTLSDTLIPLVSLKTPSQHYASTVQFLRNFCISCTRKLFYLIIRQSIQETAGNIQQKEARKSHKHKSQSRMQQIHVNTSKFTYKTSFINLVLVKKDQQQLESGHHTTRTIFRSPKYFRTSLFHVEKIVPNPPQTLQSTSIPTHDPNPRP